MKNFLYRVITSLVLLPIVILAFFKGGLLLSALLTLVLMICAYEVASMVMPQNNYFAIAASLLGFLIMISLLCAKTVELIPALAFIIIAINTYLLFSKNADSIYFEKISAIFFFTLYVALAIASIYWLREYPDFNDDHAGLAFIVLACAATWGNDTLAYFGGKSFGRRPLFKRVSAKKTWEGFIFGALGSITVMACFLFINNAWEFFPSMSTGDCLFTVIPAIILAPLGDLIESRLKRIYNMKDSSQILPGHGGILDRIDGLLVVLPWTAAYAFFIRPLW